MSSESPEVLRHRVNQDNKEFQRNCWYVALTIAGFLLVFVSCQSVNEAQSRTNQEQYEVIQACSVNPYSYDCREKLRSIPDIP